jgi:hypothetical protein
MHMMMNETVVDSKARRFGSASLRKFVSIAPGLNLVVAVERLEQQLLRLGPYKSE